MVNHGGTDFDFGTDDGPSVESISALGELAAAAAGAAAVASVADAGAGDGGVRGGGDDAAMPKSISAPAKQKT